MDTNGDATGESAEKPGDHSDSKDVLQTIPEEDTADNRPPKRRRSSACTSEANDKSSKTTLSDKNSRPKSMGSLMSGAEAIEMKPLKSSRPMSHGDSKVSFQDKPISSRSYTRQVSHNIIFL